MKYAVEMGSGAVVCILGFMNTRGDSQTHRQHGDIISLLLLFFKIRKIG
jgi:hypothetical protein